MKRKRDTEPVTLLLTPKTTRTISNEETSGPRLWRKKANFPRLRTTGSLLRKSRQGDARSLPSTLNRRHCQKEAPPDCICLPRPSPLAHIGPGGSPFLRAGRGSRTVGPSPTTHQKRPPPRFSRQAGASPPRRGQHCGRRHHARPRCLLDRRTHSIEQEGRRPPTGEMR